MRVFVDTSAFYALVSATDEFHDRARETLKHKDLRSWNKGTIGKFLQIDQEKVQDGGMEAFEETKVTVAKFSVLVISPVSTNLVVYPGLSLVV